MTSTLLPAFRSPSSSPSHLPLDSAPSLTALAFSPISSPFGFDDSAVPSTDRLAGELDAFERLLRQTIAAGSRLVTVAAETQADHDMSPIAGHQIYQAFNAANLDVSSALANVAKGHRQLHALAKGMGIDVTGYGSTHEPPAADVFFTTGDASYSNVS